ncbi:MAG: lipocalin family protein [Bacteroidetes bacterium]|nr:lipocalin family protein [Bacteroidota bacterium]
MYFVSIEDKINLDVNEKSSPNNAMKRLGTYLISLTMLFSSCCTKKHLPLDTVPAVDLNRYAGKWYEIAKYPVRFEEGCRCVTAEYSLTSKGYVTVTNRCQKSGGKLSSINGKAFVVKGSNNAKLKVQFFWPFRANYWIIDLSPDYSYAVVSDPHRKYLWILCRTRTMESQVFNAILGNLTKKGFDIDKLEKTDQECH